MIIPEMGDKINCGNQIGEIIFINHDRSRCTVKLNPKKEVEILFCHLEKCSLPEFKWAATNTIKTIIKKEDK